MKLNWKLCPSVNKYNQLLLKLAVAILLMGLAFRFLFFSSQEFSSPDLETTPVVAKTDVAEATPPDNFTIDVSEYEDQNLEPEKEPDDENDTPQKENDTPQKDSGEEKCDIFTGDWIPDQSGPVYTNASCAFIEGHQNCMRNGRPDTGYLYWRWKPRNCQLPQFNAEKLLSMMRNKTWALIGDSISRNHVQSLLCMLSTVEKAVEVYHDEEFKSKTWQFPSYNFSLLVVWSPFLAKAAIFEDINGVSTSEVELHLDKLDKKWTEQYFNIDYMIISTGKWFLKSAIYYENDTVVGCHYCPKRNLTELGFDYAYNKTLYHVMDFIATSKHKGLVFFRTSTPDHFENGEWHNGGTCKKTSPVNEGEIEIKDLHRILRNIELAAFQDTAAKAVENGVKFKLLDFTNLLLLRPDGHPGPYRSFHPFAEDKNATVQNDCLHWCLPGPLDAWNDLIMEMMVNTLEN
ncbi:protein trichome birefringence-like 23 isoform X2 [Pistacia vera]|uniref:protein trichome birefringence-like 23 isoform X2 n=1 Tax=Pistacia vera TaxID=55513 RepID=UPI001262E9F5|nr:protein trichome birefringence-like 23 isoform X2 [Pistacia vera]